MYKVKYLTVEITKDKMTKIETDLPQWEAQVAVALWGEEAQILGETFVTRELPEVNDEFTRLANKYGPRDEDVPIVARVYGSFGPGLRALEQEFSASTMSISTDETTENAGTKTGGVSGNGVVPGVRLPSSDKTFGLNAVPEVRDDVPALAGNLVTVGGEVKPIEEVLAAGAQTGAELAANVIEAQKNPDEFADLTGEGDIVGEVE